MAFALGYIDAVALANIKTLYSIKEDELEDGSLQAFRGGDNGLFISEKSAKAEISLDLDFVIDSEFKDLRAVLLNRAYPNKIYIREPGNVTGAIIHPTTALNKAYVKKGSTLYPAFADFTTEFTTTDYTRINAFSTPCSNTITADEYIHYLFLFSLSDWLTAGGGSLNNLLRLTLFMQTPAAYRTHPAAATDKFGILVRAYNWSTTSFIEMYRRSITLTAANQQAAGLRPITGFTTMRHFIGDEDGSYPNMAAFMVSVLQPRAGAGTVYLDMNYVACLVNGFMVRMTDVFNVNWREEITLVGRTGNIKLSEV